MKKSICSKLAIVTVFMLTTMTFAGFTTKTTSAAKQTTLTYNAGDEIPSLDPQLENSIPSANVSGAINEGLVRVHNGAVQPGMAESWNISKDGKTYTFHLRDAKWSDGKAVTAQDFKYGLIRLLNPKTASAYASAGYYILNGEAYNEGKITDPNKVGVTAKDAHTLIIKLVNPTSYFLSYTSLSCFNPTRQDLVEKYGVQFAADADKNVYNGPFILKEWKHADHATLEKNPNYWNKSAIKLDKVTILMIKDKQTALNMYLSGQLDFVDVPSQLAETYTKSGQAKVYMTGADDWLKINTKAPGKPWLANVNFRKALNYALDRNTYVKVATKGLYFPATRLVLPMVAGAKGGKYTDEAPINIYPASGDLDKAKRFLKMAMTELKITDSKKIEFELKISDRDETTKICEVIQDQLTTKLGITVNIKRVTYKQMLDDGVKGKYDTVYAGWGPDYDDPMTYMELFEGNNSQNSTGFKNKKYDILVENARREPNKVKRQTMLQEAEKILVNEAPFIPLQYRQNAWLCKDNLEGVARYFIGADTDYVYAYFK